MLDAIERGCYTIEIDPEDTIISDAVDIKIPLDAAKALDRIWKEYSRRDRD